MDRVKTLVDYNPSWRDLESGADELINARLVQQLEDASMSLERPLRGRPVFHDLTPAEQAQLSPWAARHGLATRTAEQEIA